MRKFYLEYLLIRIKNIFFTKMNCDIFANFTSNICSLLRHFFIFYLEYLLITTTFLHILPRISADLGHKILNSRNSELRLQAYSSNPVENMKNFIFSGEYAYSPENIQKRHQLDFSGFSGEY